MRTPIPALAALLAVAAALPAAAQPAQCGARDRVLAHLADSYGETRRAIGRAANDVVVEVFASAATGSWTITATLPNGMMCLVAAGEGFEAVTEAAPARGTPA
ncbi:MAG: hypothetical protein IT545_07295 [Rhodobacteraceae bacterium]|nr:hypothetical protein [Paracoccaceae bacterium]